MAKGKGRKSSKISSNHQYSLPSKTISLQNQDHLDVDLHTEGHLHVELVHFESNGEETLVQEADTVASLQNQEQEGKSKHA